MTERQPPPMPEWAKKERLADLAWIKDNFHVFWPMAQLGYQKVGRGCIFVDATVTIAHEQGQGNLIAYLEQAEIEQIADEDTQRMIREYAPDTEFVTTLLKTKNRTSSYRVGYQTKSQS